MFSFVERKPFKLALMAALAIVASAAPTFASEAELILTPLAELPTREIPETTEATGMNENKAAAKTGGGIARKARQELESKTGKKVVSGENYLPPSARKIK